MEPIKWTDRRFSFDFPIGVFPWIIERLRGTPARVEQLVSKIPREMLVRKLDGKWSIQENVGHLIKVEELHDGRIDDFLAKKATLRAADMENKRTEAANFNAMNLDTILESFRTARMNLVKRLEELDEAILKSSSHHPRLDVPMRPVDMAYFAAEHDDYHLSVMVRLARAMRK